MTLKVNHMFFNNIFKYNFNSINTDIKMCKISLYIYSLKKNMFYIV